MAIRLQGQSGYVLSAEGGAFRGLAVHPKPIEYGSLGHYQTAFKTQQAATQSNGSRLFEVRNSHATNLIIPTRLMLAMSQRVGGTVEETGLACFRMTNFTVLDTTQTVTPTASPKRTSMAAPPGAAGLRHKTNAAGIGGMGGGTMTSDGNAFFSCGYEVSAAARTNGLWGPFEVFPDKNGEAPFVFTQNEGFDVEVQGGITSNAEVVWYFIFAWAEVTAY